MDFLRKQFESVILWYKWYILFCSQQILNSDFELIACGRRPRRQFLAILSCCWHLKISLLVLNDCFFLHYLVLHIYILINFHNFRQLITWHCLLIVVILFKCILLGLKLLWLLLFIMRCIDLILNCCPIDILLCHIVVCWVLDLLIVQLIQLFFDLFIICFLKLIFGLAIVWL